MFVCGFVCGVNACVSLCMCIYIMYTCMNVCVHVYVCTNVFVEYVFGVYIWISGQFLHHNSLLADQSPGDGEADRREG